MKQGTNTLETEQSIKTGRAAQIAKPNSGIQIEKYEYQAPQARQVRLKIEACGVCHSDSFPMGGGFPGQKYPIVPGHEMIGIVEAIGDGVGRLKIGDRVGVGWHGGHCHECPSCRAGDFITCQKLQVPGITMDGGYAEYAIFSEEVCAVIPEKLLSAEAAPLLCAGVTTFNALRHSGAGPGDIVAIQGLGGLGHLAVQFACKMGFETVAIARGKEKKSFAHELGAKHYIDSEQSDATETLKKLGGAKVILTTITSSKAMNPWISTLAINGRMVIVGAGMEPLEISPISLIGARSSVAGWPSGTAKDSEDCLNFAALTGIRPMIESYPFEKAEEAYQRMMSGKARFRVVIELNKKS
jgi:D-arabinose 1-dehydrogenase-like Zn-dependent alcohol dehydrogenase